jgi:hypothetical protein
MKSSAKSPERYLAELPEDRRRALTKVRSVILENLPKGYVEAMDWGMISYQVPLATCPDTYNGKPLMYAALASQKGYMVVYLSAIYADSAARAAFEKAYRATGKRYDVGQSCVRFRKLDDLPLDVIGDAIAATPAAKFVEHYEASRRGAASKSKAEARAKRGTKPSGGKKSAGKSRATRKGAARKGKRAKRS